MAIYHKGYIDQKRSNYCFILFDFLFKGGFWDEQDGFYYDRLRAKNGYHIYLRIRSVVGLIPFFSIVHLKDEMVKALPKLKERIDYHLKRDPQLQDYVSLIIIAFELNNLRS